MAYQALHDSFEQKTEKRILELEKQYDLSAKQAELDKAKSERRLLWLSLFFTLISAGLLVAILLLTRRNLALANQKRIKDAIVQSIVKAVVASYAGINNKLSVIHNLPEKQRQAALERLIIENRNKSSTNLIKALFVLTEMGFPLSEIAGLLGISSSQDGHGKAQKCAPIGK